jgi:hypothetical protein
MTLPVRPNRNTALAARQRMIFASEGGARTNLLQDGWFGRSNSGADWRYVCEASLTAVNRIARRRGGKQQR